MLKRLGTVLHTTPSGYIVAKIEEEQVPPLNTVVYDEDMNRVGVLLDIIGPVKSPYAVVKPSSREVRVEKGVKLYYRPPSPRRRRARKPARAAKGARKPVKHRDRKQGEQKRRRSRGGKQPRRGERRGGGGRPRGRRGSK
ncbi:RNA binding protein, Gar1-type [Pyrodictium delaneyi]|uniref:RNA binding protein, Gar1-type n=1 Tax=Pyrodictium delaneyi TaxID=1273541 RepID=A0A0P0N1L6_9CREN|nr:Gar1/Naf1 family protein [Pyrodictium delaneyi]ALL00151.1 RNA binding protein, Gar1-type [Pyrodictium delaneyi]OWJ54241.1 hypothetical protein Pdsh_07055 [Pyrodictium delaneyi]